MRVRVSVWKVLEVLMLVLCVLLNCYVLIRSFMYPSHVGTFLSLFIGFTAGVHLGGWVTKRQWKKLTDDALDVAAALNKLVKQASDEARMWRQKYHTEIAESGEEWKRGK